MLSIHLLTEISMAYLSHIYIRMPPFKFRWVIGEVIGSLLDPPVVAKEVLFAPIDAPRAELHEPIPCEIQQDQTVSNLPLSLGSDNLDLAKKACLNSGLVKTYLIRGNFLITFRQRVSSDESRFQRTDVPAAATVRETRTIASYINTDNFQRIKLSLLR